MRLWLDLETYSGVPITHGTHAYAAGAEVMLFAWGLDDEPAQVWDCTAGGPMPDRLAAALGDATALPKGITGITRHVLKG